MTTPDDSFANDDSSSKRPLVIGTIVAIVAVIAVIFAATQLLGDDDADADGSAGPTTIRIGYQNIPNGDLVVKNQKLLEQALGDDVTVDWQLFESGGEVNQAFLAGGLDVGLAGSSPVSRGLSTGIPYEVPWIHDVIGSAEALVAREGIDTVADLKGKKIATPIASTAHYSLLAALDDAGLSADDVTIIDAENIQGLAAWTAGDIDAIYTWNPTLAEIKGAGGHVLIDSSQLAAEGKVTYDLAVVSTDFATKYPAAVQSWVDAQAQAVQQLLDNDEAAYQSIADELDISVEDVKEQTAGLVFVSAADQASADHLDGVLPTNLYAAAKFNQEQGEIDEVADEDAYRTASNAAFAAAVK